MKSVFRSVSVALALMAGSIGVAQASPPNSNSVKYFDESGNLVGQQYLLCDGRAGHGGNTHTAYHIDEQTSCNGGETPDWIVPGKIVIAYTLPSSLNITTACSIASCQGTHVPEVNILGLWPYSTGWQ